MKIKHIASLLVAAALLCMTVPALAQDNPANYLMLKGGIYVPNEDFNLDPIIEDNRLNPGSGFNGEVAIGRYFAPFFAVEIGAGYFESDGTSPSSRLGELEVIPVVATGKLLLPIGPVEPYGLFGIGAYFTSLDFDETDSTRTTYGLHAGAGVNFNLTRNFFVGVEGRYLWAEPEFEGEDVPIDGFTGTGNLGFRF